MGQLNNLANQQVWRKRMEEIEDPVKHLVMPKDVDDDTDQDQEWCEVVIGDKTRRIRFHDYDQVFDIPGLYEKLFYDALKCCSPSYMTNLFKDVAAEWGTKFGELKVLDVGAGNGMVGDELRHRGVAKVVGVDIIEEAKKAALRDRADVYDDYRVADLTALPETDEAALRKHQLNCMTTVAALGYGDIPPAAFLKAMDLIATPGWLAFNIKESFLHESDRSGFSSMIRRLIQQDYIQPQCYRRYRHRVSMTGEPLYYIAMIAKKCKTVNGDLLSEFA